MPQEGMKQSEMILKWHKCCKTFGKKAHMLPYNHKNLCAIAMKTIRLRIYITESSLSPTVKATMSLLALEN